MTVLDSYAVIAYLRDEPAAEDVASLLTSETCTLTAIGLAEVVDRMVRLVGAPGRDLALDLAELGLARPIAVDADLAFDAGRLRAQHYHRTTRAVSLADCVAAAAARKVAEPLATSDPHLLDLCHEEGIAVTPLPASDGSAWAPS